MIEAVVIIAFAVLNLYYSSESLTIIVNMQPEFLKLLGLGE